MPLFGSVVCLIFRGNYFSNSKTHCASIVVRKTCIVLNVLVLLNTTILDGLFFPRKLMDYATL